MNDLPYRQGVYGFILNNSNNILLVHKRNSKMWDFPGGGVDAAESFKEAIKREIKEELEIDNVVILHKASFTYSYDWPKSEIEKHFKKTGLHKKGQEQTHFILRFNGEDSEIKLQNEELLEYKWISASKLQKYMGYPDQYDNVVKVFEEFNKPNIFE